MTYWRIVDDETGAVLHRTTDRAEDRGRLLRSSGQRTGRAVRAEKVGVFEVLETERFDPGAQARPVFGRPQTGRG